MTKEEKKKAVEILRRRYTEQIDDISKIEWRLSEYFNGLSCEPEYHNGWEILCAVKFLRLLRTYEFDHKMVRKVIWLREGDWHQEQDGRWIHDSGGLKCPGTDTAHVYMWQPFQVFVLASVFGFRTWINTQVESIRKPELLSTERVRNDGMIEDLRRLCNYFVCFMPRKTDKTGLSAYIQIVFFLLGDFSAECYCCAMSEQQSKILFNRTKFMLSQLNEQNQWRMTEKVVDWKPQYRNIRNSSIMPLTAGGKAKDGAFAALVNWDEYGSSPYTNGKSDMQALVNVMRSSMGPRREPLTFGTTTAGTINTGPFIEMLDGLHRSLLRELDYDSGDDVPTFSGDRSLCLLLEPDDWEKQDEEYLMTCKELRRKVNPMLGTTCQHQFYDDSLEDVRNGKMTKGEYIAKLINVYESAVVTEWVRPEIIRSRQVERRIEDCQADLGWDVYVGMDFSQGNDLHAATYLAVKWHDDGTVEYFADLDAWINEETLHKSSIRDLYELWISQGWLRLSEGEVFQPNLPVKRIRELDGVGLNFIGFGYDSKLSKDPINELKAWLQSLGIKADDICIPISQTYSSYNPAVDRLTYLLKNNDLQLTFSPSPLWPWEFGNTVLDVDTRMGNQKPLKRNPGSDACKVDNVQCLCNCFLLEEHFEGIMK